MSKQIKFEDVITLNFDMCNQAYKLFTKALDKAIPENKEEIKDAIVAVDIYLGVEKNILTKGFADDSDLEDMQDAVKDAKNEIADAGLKGHNYHNKHLRKVKSMLTKNVKESVLIEEIDTINEEFEQYLVEGFVDWDKILKVMTKQVNSGVEPQDAAWNLSRASGVKFSAKQIYNEFMKNDKPKDLDPVRRAVRQKLLNKYERNFNFAEDRGAGEEATDELAKNYKKDTPNEDIEESVLNEQCDLIGRSQIKAFEKVVDRLFEKFGIDFNFTKHFGERMSDSRNTPCIKIEELANFVKKIYSKQGKSIKNVAGAEAVINDMQTDLNIPVAVTYDSKNDEFDVALKTIMRKKNFKSPDKIIRYK